MLFSVLTLASWPCASRVCCATDCRAARRDRRRSTSSSSSLVSYDTRRVGRQSCASSYTRWLGLHNRRSQREGQPLSPGYDAASGVSLPGSLPHQQLGAVQAPADVCALGLVRGVAADQSKLAVSQRQKLAKWPRPPASANHIRTCTANTTPPPNCISTASPAPGTTRDQPNPSRAWLEIGRLIYDPTSRPCLARGKPLILRCLLTSGFLFRTSAFSSYRPRARSNVVTLFWTRIAL